MDSRAENSAETERLLQLIRCGERLAIDQLFARHRPELRHFVQLRLDPKLRPRLDPSDVVQEAQLEALRRLDDYLQERPMPFRLWLRQIAYDRPLMVRRQHIRAERRTVERDVALARPVFALARPTINGRWIVAQRAARQARAGAPGQPGRCTTGGHRPRDLAHAKL